VGIQWETRPTTCSSLTWAAAHGQHRCRLRARKAGGFIPAQNGKRDSVLRRWARPPGRAEAGSPRPRAGDSWESKRTLGPGPHRFGGDHHAPGRTGDHVGWLDQGGRAGGPPSSVRGRRPACCSGTTVGRFSGQASAGPGPRVTQWQPRCPGSGGNSRRARKGGKRSGWSGAERVAMPADDAGTLGEILLSQRAG